MKNNKVLCYLTVILCAFSLFSVEVKSAVTVNWNKYSRHVLRPGGYWQDLPAHFCYQNEARHGILIDVSSGGPTNDYYACMQWQEIPVGESRTFDRPVIVWDQQLDYAGESIPLAPKPHFGLTIRKSAAAKPEPIFCMALLSTRRRVMLQYPPAGSVWHTPGGVSQLTSVLRKDGHEVKQRWSHIIGLEHILLVQNETDVARALSIIRSTSSNFQELYEARKIFERTSESISTKDKFRFERNNVIYQSQYQDGSICGALNAIEDKESHLWYPYFHEVEIPATRDFNPQIYGVSIGDERQLFPGLVLASMVKSEFPDCIVIVGGNFFGRMPDPQNSPDFAELFNHIDGIVYAEGFQPLQQISNTLDVRTTTGMIWRSGNEVIKNPRTTNPTDFGSLPTPALDGDAKQWSPETEPTFYTQSHCKMDCAFCAIAAQSDTFAQGRLDNAQKIKPRSMTPRQIAEHMRATKAHKFDITDELFPIQRQLELGKELRTIGYSATWQCYLTVTDNLINPQIARLLYDAGCRSVQFGLETLSKDTLLKVHKQWNTPGSYEKILQNFRDAGIHTHTFLMVGLPSEPLYEGLRWVGFLEKYGHNILTIKSGRWRPARYAPEVEKGLLESQVELYPDTKPFQTNRSFRYLSATHSNTKVDAMRDVVEQACRKHWAYNVTSTIPWWINRSRYSWDQLEEIAKALPAEPDIPHLNDRIAQMRYLVRTELGRKENFRTWDELVAFATTLL